MLDAVTTALKPKSNEGSPSSEPGKVTASEPKAEAEQTSAKAEANLAPEDLARLSMKANVRYRALVGQRDEAEAKAKELEPKAAQYDLITRQIRETGLDKTDLNSGFEIMTALKKGDMFKARDLLVPIYEQVMRLTGGVMPKDLAEEARAGQITEARAHELAVARAAAEQHANRQAMAQRDSEARGAAELATSVVDTVNAWEKAKAAIDPDWKLKSPEIMRAIELSLLKGNRPKSAQEAVAMAETALTEVSARLRSYRPAPKAIRAVVGGVGASSRNVAAPKNMLDIVNQMIG